MLPISSSASPGVSDEGSWEVEEVDSWVKYEIAARYAKKKSHTTTGPRLLCARPRFGPPEFSLSAVTDKGFLQAKLVPEEPKKEQHSSKG